MSQKQAEEFANTYTVIAQSPFSITGFSATVFRHTDGRLHFAIRGTELPNDPTAFFLDWVTNLADIGADGIAVSQGIAMFNWLQRLLAAPGNAVVQYEINDGYFIGKTYVPPSITTTTGTATGELVNYTGTTLSAAGHSLGGHLAIRSRSPAPAPTCSARTATTRSLGASWTISWTVARMPTTSKANSAMTP